MNNKSFNIILSNRYLTDGIPTDKTSQTGLMKFRLPESITIPSHAIIKIESFVADSNIPEHPIILSIEEFNNSSWIGDNNRGRRNNGFIGLMNDDIVNKRMFSEIDLNNTSPFQIQELTLRIQDSNGLSSSLNKPAESEYYNLEAVNTWERNDGQIFTAVRLDETHWKLVGTGNTYFLEFTTPLGGTIGGNNNNTFVLDPAVQVPQTNPNLTMTFGATVRTFTPFAGAGLTSPIPFQGIVSDFALHIKIKQDPQHEMKNILRENRDMMKGLILNRRDNN